MKNILFALCLFTSTLAFAGKTKGLNLVPIVRINQADPGSEKVSQTLCDRYLIPMAKDLGYTAKRAYALPSGKSDAALRKELRSLPSSTTLFLVVDLEMWPRTQHLFTYSGWIQLYQEVPDVDSGGSIKLPKRGRLRSFRIPYQTSTFLDSTTGLLFDTIHGSMKVLGFEGVDLLEKLKRVLKITTGESV